MREEVKKALAEKRKAERNLKELEALQKSEQQKVNPDQKLLAMIQQEINANKGVK